MKFPWQASRERAVQAAVEAARAEEQRKSVDLVVRAVQAVGAQRNVFALDNPIWYTTPQSPKRRPTSLLDTYSLRDIAEKIDIVRSAIEHLKREVRAVPFTFRVRNAEDGQELSTGEQQMIQDAKDWFRRQGGCGGCGTPISEFETMWIEDLLVIGSTALYLERSITGQVLQAVPIDSSTIRPVVDAYGFAPSDKPQFEQWIMGVQGRGYYSDEMLWTGINARTWTPYYQSPLEWLISPITSSAASDRWNQTWLTDGNAPGDDVYSLGLPEDAPPELAQAWATMLDATLSGNTPERRKMLILPKGSQRLSTGTRREHDFAEFDLWLLRRIFSLFGVQPAALGYSGEQYKVSQEGSIKAGSRFGAGTLLDKRKEIYDILLEEMGLGDLEAVNVSDEEEDATARASRLSIATGRKAWKTINEARAEEGLQPIEGGDELAAPAPDVQPEPDAPDENRAHDLGLWRSKATKRFKAGRPADCEFRSEWISESDAQAIRSALRGATDLARIAQCFQL